MSVNTELRLLPGMPRETITGFCLPVALAALGKIEKFNRAGKAILVEKDCASINPELRDVQELLSNQLRDVYNGPYYSNASNPDYAKPSLDEYIAGVRGFLSTFCEEYTSEACGPLTIERRNAIAYEALIALKMKEGVNIGQNTKREMVNFLGKLPNSDPEEVRQFYDVFFADFINRAMNGK